MAGSSRRSSRSSAPDHDVLRLAVQESIRTSLWFVPFVGVVAATLLALVLVVLDDGSVSAVVAFDGDASGAQDLLTTIASSTLTMTTLVVSITVVALQLASQQFSPRVMRTFFRDRGTKTSLAIFLATTVYALVVLRSVKPETADRPEYVPELAVSAAFVLMVASLLTFLYFVNHVAHAIRAVYIMDAVAEEAREAVRELPEERDELGPGDWPDRQADAVLTSEQPPGVLLGVDEDDLMALAAERGLRIRILPPVGTFMPSGYPLAEVWSDTGPTADPDLSASELVRHVGIGHERTMSQDLAFGIRQLVDMADRALSPGINDPTTAVQALGRIHDLLRRVAQRPDPTGVHRDGDGTARLVISVHGWDELVHLAFDEIRHYGAESFNVQRKLRLVLDDLATVVADDPARLEAIGVQRDLVDRAARRAFVDIEDRRRVGLDD